MKQLVLVLIPLCFFNQVIDSQEEPCSCPERRKVYHKCGPMEVLSHPIMRYRFCDSKMETLVICVEDSIAKKHIKPDNCSIGRAKNNDYVQNLISDYLPGIPKQNLMYLLVKNQNETSVHFRRLIVNNEVKLIASA